ncbi:hypothetical protein ABVK25_008517 [Lepraria finkii]|uniref:Uncharacterized protein n=1 Tax=Lepraria finkii TaxID=1340010 RepID=A0ABR4B048_9LECA
MLCVRAVSNAMSTQEPLTYEGRRGSRSLGRGSIVNMGSASSFVGAPGTMSYTTSKHAIIGFTKIAANQIHSVSRQYKAPHPRERHMPFVGRHANDGACSAAQAAAGAGH